MSMFVALMMMSLGVSLNHVTDDSGVILEVITVKGWNRFSVHCSIFYKVPVALSHHSKIHLSSFQNWPVEVAAPILREKDR